MTTPDNFDSAGPCMCGGCRRCLRAQGYVVDPDELKPREPEDDDEEEDTP